MRGKASTKVHFSCSPVFPRQHSRLDLERAPRPCYLGSNPNYSTKELCDFVQDAQLLYAFISVKQFSLDDSESPYMLNNMDIII